MKTYIVILIITVSVSLQAQKIDLKNVYSVEARIGLTEYPIDETTLPEIISAFGNNYIQVLNQYFINGKIKEGFEKLPLLLEIKYKNMGVSFYYLAQDSSQIIKAVKFSKPFKVKTKTDITLGKSTLGDILKLYDNKAKIYTSGPNIKNGEAHINRFMLPSTGITFSSHLKEFDKDNFPSKEKLKNQILDEIYISNMNYLNRILVH